MTGPRCPLCRHFGSLCRTTRWSARKRRLRGGTWSERSRASWPRPAKPRASSKTTSPPSPVSHRMASRRLNCGRISVLGLQFACSSVCMLAPPMRVALKRVEHLIEFMVWHGNLRCFFFYSTLEGMIFTWKCIQENINILFSH